MTTPAHTVYPLGSYAEHGSLIDQAFRASHTLPWHEHGDAYLSLVASGAYREVYGSGSLHFASGTAVFHPAGESHRDEFGAAGGRVINLSLPQLLIRSALGQRAPRCTSRVFVDGPVPFLLYGLARVARWSRTGWRTDALEIVTELVGHVADSESSADPRPPRWLESAVALIRREFRRPIGLAEVSLAVGVHPAHVAREFRRHVRASVGEYVRSLRIAWACEELTRGRLPLARIAFESGYFDQAHFCRSFRRECGCPPSQFRRSVRTPDPGTSTH